MLGLPDKNTEIQGMVDLGLHGRRMAKKTNHILPFSFDCFYFDDFLEFYRSFGKNETIGLQCRSRQ